MRLSSRSNLPPNWVLQETVGLVFFCLEIKSLIIEFLEDTKMTDQDALFILGLIVSAALWVLTLFVSEPEDKSEGYKGGRTPDKYKMDDYNTFTASPSRARRRARRFKSWLLTSFRGQFFCWFYSRQHCRVCPDEVNRDLPEGRSEFIVLVGSHSSIDLNQIDLSPGLSQSFGRQLLFRHRTPCSFPTRLGRCQHIVGKGPALL